MVKKFEYDGTIMYGTYTARNDVGRFYDLITQVRAKEESFSVKRVSLEQWIILDFCNCSQCHAFRIRL